MATLLHRLGWAIHRARHLVVALWVGTLVLLAVGAVTLAGTTSTSFEIPGQESTDALHLIDQKFGGGSNATAQVVVQAPAGRPVTDPRTAAGIGRLVAELGALPGVAQASNPFDKAVPTVAPDRQAAYTTLTYATGPGDVTPAQRQALLDAVGRADSRGLQVDVKGDAVQGGAPEVLGPSEAIGVVVALLVLAVTYGSLVAAGMNLLTAVVGVGIGMLGITTATGFWDLQSTTSILAAMLGLAVGIDYALFIFTRFRHELRAGRSVQEAVALAVGTAGSAVVTAGLTVVIALAGLFVAGIPFLTEMGVAAALTVVIAVLVAITLVPAVLGMIGTRALPRSERRELAAHPGTSLGDPATEAAVAGGAEPGGGYARFAGTLVRHRWVALLAAVLVLGVLSVPALSLRTTLVQAPADGTTEARATDAVAEHFGPGVNGPLLVLVDGPGAVPAAAGLAKSAPSLPDVALVTPPQPSPDGRAALVTVIPKSDPDSQATEDLVQALRDQAAAQQADGGPRVYVSGQTAVSVDVADQLSSALPVYLLLVVGLALVLLVLVFRSLLVPLVGVIGFLLTIGSAFGAAVAVFQWGWLADLLGIHSTGPLLSLMPILVVGILFGLAMDYQVFLVSRMHEAHAHGEEARRSIRTGFRQAGPVVVAAAAIMFAVFAGFVPSDDSTIKAIAFALAVGIAVDAFVVRLVMVPSALAVLGERAWWLPRWLRWLPVLDVEGSALGDRGESTGAGYGSREGVTR